jgi:hypothetical protein
MKPSPPPNVPGNTEAERMSNALSMVLTVSKKDLLKKEARLKRASEKKRAKKPSWPFRLPPEVKMTQRFYVCKCPGSVYAASLFDTLLEFSKSPQSCESCGSIKELRVVFPFGLGAGTTECKVIDVFHESDWWQDGHKKTTFHPFLVVVQPVESGTTKIWLPYWHCVEDSGKTHKKYGQWAPNMDVSLFESLINQARARGHLASWVVNYIVTQLSVEFKTKYADWPSMNVAGFVQRVYVEAP